jgi:hypothetical protein
LKCIEGEKSELEREMQLLKEKASQQRSEMDKLSLESTENSDKAIWTEEMNEELKRTKSKLLTYDKLLNENTQITQKLQKDKAILEQNVQLYYFYSFFECYSFYECYLEFLD